MHKAKMLVKSGKKNLTLLNFLCGLDEKMKSILNFCFRVKSLRSSHYYFWGEVVGLACYSVSMLNGLTSQLFKLSMTHRVASMAVMEHKVKCLPHVIIVDFRTWGDNILPENPSSCGSVLFCLSPSFVIVRLYSDSSLLSV